MSYAFMRPHFRKTSKPKTETVEHIIEHKWKLSEKEVHDALEKYQAKNHKEIVKEGKPESKSSITLHSASPFWRRVWNLLKNPITYLFYGRVEW